MNKEKTPVVHKILTGIGTALCIVLIPILIINCTLLMKSYLNKDAVPSFGSFSPMIVLSESMYPEIEVGDLILCRHADPQEIQVGDVICFFDPTGNGTSTVTHRVMEITTDKNGDLAWVTKGDANNAEDRMAVPADKLVGKYNGARIPGAGDMAMFMQTTKGLMICVVVPMILLFGWDALRRAGYSRKHEKDRKALMAELEELRRLKEEGSASAVSE